MSICFFICLTLVTINMILIKLIICYTANNKNFCFSYFFKSPIPIFWKYIESHNNSKSTKLNHIFSIQRNIFKNRLPQNLTTSNVKTIIFSIPQGPNKNDNPATLIRNTTPKIKKQINKTACETTFERALTSSSFVIQENRKTFRRENLSGFALHKSPTPKRKYYCEKRMANPH